MRKISRGRSENDEPLSAGRVEYLEQARQRVRTGASGGRPSCWCC